MCVHVFVLVIYGDTALEVGVKWVKGGGFHEALMMYYHTITLPIKSPLSPLCPPKMESPTSICVPYQHNLHSFYCTEMNKP